MKKFQSWTRQFATAVSLLGSSAAALAGPLAGTVSAIQNEISSASTPLALVAIACVAIAAIFGWLRKEWAISLTVGIVVLYSGPSIISFLKAAGASA